MAAIGLAVGLLTGLLGVGGGFLIVPALVLLGGVPMQNAVGTSLLIITLNSISGFLGYLGKVTIHPGGMLPVLVLALGGVLLGLRLAGRITPGRLRRAFAVFLLVVGAAILVQGKPTPASSSAPSDTR
jgi:hypothetical protein